ncbi:hypothetical protein CS542_08870 [Pedobacter sp. IW39]|nr:hypothetical protein CS542_08870 [Pedobacter sp. IW39]
MRFNGLCAVPAIALPEQPVATSTNSTLAGWGCASAFGSFSETLLTGFRQQIEVLFVYTV